jgi:hypothetical protein
LFQQALQQDFFGQLRFFSRQTRFAALVLFNGASNLGRGKQAVAG